jgi:hypothetical protein
MGTGHARLVEQVEFVPHLHFPTDFYFREVFVCKPGRTVAPKPTKFKENVNSTMFRMKARRAAQERKRTEEAEGGRLRDGGNGESA